MSNILINEIYIQDIADAIRDNQGTTSSYTISQMTNISYNKILSDFLMARSNITSFSCDYSYIRPYAFKGCDYLVSVNFPKCTAIGSYAFQSCFSLTTISFPACTSIASYAFSACSKLGSANFPVCTSMGSSTFLNCRYLTSVNFPVCTTIGNYAFYGCSSLTTVSFPFCTIIGSYAFAYCSKFLASISFPLCEYIGPSAFNYCSLLSTIYIGTSDCILNNSNAFSGTGIWSDKGSIYVRSSCVDTYKAAANWTFFSNRIVGY